MCAQLANWSLDLEMCPLKLSQEQAVRLRGLRPSSWSEVLVCHCLVFQPRWGWHWCWCLRFCKNYAALGWNYLHGGIAWYPARPKVHASWLAVAECLYKNGQRNTTLCQDVNFRLLWNYFGSNCRPKTIAATWAWLFVCLYMCTVCEGWTQCARLCTCRALHWGENHYGDEPFMGDVKALARSVHSAPGTLWFLFSSALGVCGGCLGGACCLRWPCRKCFWGSIVHAVPLEDKTSFVSKAVCSVG